ncbi:hypothetical protein [Streptomyces sp. NPDC020362]|uniref:hypothetical protein n=1 Tax=unclassified Streptomyces TaxID=2593676 RepID=UPI0033D26965
MRGPQTTAVHAGRRIRSHRQHARTNSRAAHLLALDRLHAGHQVGGRAYFIAQDEPLPVAGLALRLLAAAGVTVRWQALPRLLVHAAAAAQEASARLSRSASTHALSRFLAAELTAPHWYDLTAARVDVGFVPPVTMAQGFTELARAASVPQAAAFLRTSRAR